MNRSDISQEDYTRILDSVVETIREKGLKATTMDTVASKLGMSKRTLYELFDSKAQMVEETFDQMARRYAREHLRLYHESANVMEAILRISLHHAAVMEAVSPEFFFDMDRLYPEIRRKYEEKGEDRSKEVHKIFQLGQQQGMFRMDLDIRMQMIIFEIQMEAFKRSSQHLPDGITSPDVFRAITIGFLRSIATPAGMVVLEELLEKSKSSIQ